MAKAEKGRLDTTLKNRGFDTSHQGYETSLGFYGFKPKIDSDGKTYLDMSSTDPIDVVDRGGDKRVRTTDDHSANSSIFDRHLFRVWKNRATGVLETLRLKAATEEQKEKREIWNENKEVWAEKPTGTFKRTFETLDENGKSQLTQEDVDIHLAPRSMLKAAANFMNGHSLRYRGNLPEIYSNIRRLGLENQYGPHENGIEVKHPEIYKDGTSMLDIALATEEGKPEKTPLVGIDLEDAFVKATKYVREIHERGPIGELLLADIQFKTREGNKVSDPVLGVPDIVWNDYTVSSDRARKATDMLDFMANTAFILRKSGKTPGEIQKYLDTIVTTYNDSDVMRSVRAFANPDRTSGKRLTLPGEKGEGLRFVSNWHNTARLGANKDHSIDVRNEVFQAADKFLHPPVAA